MLDVREIWKTYERQPLLCGISLQVAEGETVCLLGRSGSGKSTLLRIIAGLETPERGEVCWQGRDLAGTPAHRRNFGLMFQDYALFPHRNVAENVAFGLRMQNVPRAEIARRVGEALEQVNLLGFERRRVTDLSGGEQQRVALARALAPRPHLLMFDEPLGALDRTLREQLGEELRRLLHATRIPAIYVTHDQEEAFAIADRLVLLHEGRVEQSGVPEAVYRRPASAWAASFLGLSNLLTGRVVGGAPLRVETAAGPFYPAEAAALDPGTTVTLLLRPAEARLEAGETNSLTGAVTDVVFRGERYGVSLRTPFGADFQFYLEQAPVIGQSLALAFAPEAVLCLA